MNERCSSLFVYGTLMDESVQRRLLGRAVAGRAAVLAGFEKGVLRQGEAEYPILRRRAGAVVGGLVLEVSASELAIFDEYEGAEYRRVRVRPEGGPECWAYVE